VAFVCALLAVVVAATSGSGRSASAKDVIARHGGLATARLITMSSREHTSSANAASLVFGIYPGGPAGTVGPAGMTKPENPALRLSALERLRPPGRPFVVRLYSAYTGPSGYSVQRQIGQQLAVYGRAGFQTEVALCYRPADGGSAADVARFVAFVRTSLRGLARGPGFVSAQITNEANVPGAPNASDGYYKGAEDALIEGVIAAHEMVQSDHHTQVKVGFNWGYSTEQSERAFWRYLGRVGGKRFVNSLDWVGVDAYPGTWGPRLPVLAAGDVGAAAAGFMDTTLRRTRAIYLPLAGIPRRVPIIVTETGYPTGPGRTAAMQVSVMRASVEAVYRARRAYNVTGYRWFDLRDADSSSSSLESQYGIMRDDYSPKPAFAVYRQLVAELGAP
jgi:hypothetical protein